MIDNPTDFQVKFRLRMIERMALRAMIMTAAQGRSLEEARRDSSAWLEANVTLAGETAGGTGDHVTLAEIYASEAREVIDDLIAETTALTKELEAKRM